MLLSALESLDKKGDELRASNSQIKIWVKIHPESIYVCPERKPYLLELQVEISESQTQSLFVWMAEGQCQLNSHLGRSLIKVRGLRPRRSGTLKTGMETPEQTLMKMSIMNSQILPIFLPVEASHPPLLRRLLSWYLEKL